MSKFVKVEFKKVSSNIDLALYNSKRRALRVRFHGGRVYEFLNVTAYMAGEMGKAKSAGAWFSAYIRNHPKDHPAMRMDADCEMLEEIEDPEDG